MYEWNRRLLNCTFFRIPKPTMHRQKNLNRLQKKFKFLGGNASEEVIAILTRTKRKLDLLENEQNRQKDLLEKLQESQSVRQAEIHTIFEDIDNFKKQTQSMNQNQLKLERELSRIETIKITDLSNLLGTYLFNIHL